MSTFTFANDFTYDDVTKTLAVDNIDGVMKRLSSTTVNLQTLTGQTIYTVPSAKIAIITGLVCRGFTGNLDQQFKVGFNSPTFDNVSASTVYDLDVIPTTTGKCLIISLSSFASGSVNDYTTALRIQNHEEGVAAGVLKLLMSVANTAPGTMVVDVFGYLVSA